MKLKLASSGLMALAESACKAPANPPSTADKTNAKR